MRFALRIIPIVLIVLGAALLFERPAYAYVDPGSGLLAIQAAGSALVAAGWYLRRKIYLLFRRPDRKGDHERLLSAANGEDSSNS
jgi:O-antigen/teichoic acid export membrane protein